MSGEITPLVRYTFSSCVEVRKWIARVALLIARGTLFLYVSFVRNFEAKFMYLHNKMIL